MAMLKIALLALSSALLLQTAQTNTVFRLPVQQSPSGFEKHVKAAFPADQLLPREIKLPLGYGVGILGSLNTVLSLSGHGALEVNLKARPGNQLELTTKFDAKYQITLLGKKINLGAHVGIWGWFSLDTTSNGGVQCQKLTSGDRFRVEIDVKFETVITDLLMKPALDTVLSLTRNLLTQDLTSKMDDRLSACKKSINDELDSANANHQHQIVGHIGTCSSKVSKVSTEKEVIESTVESRVQQSNGQYIHFTDSPVIELPPPTEKTEYATALSEQHLNVLLANMPLSDFKLKALIYNTHELQTVNVVFKNAVEVSVAADEPVWLTITKGRIGGFLKGTIKVSEENARSLVTFKGLLLLIGTSTIKNKCMHLSLFVAGVGSLTVKEQHANAGEIQCKPMEEKLYGILKGKVFIDTCMMLIPEPMPAPEDVDKAKATPMEGCIVYHKEREDDVSQ